jgi:glycosyltransferase involved in cell wall biosynthesis
MKKAKYKKNVKVAALYSHPTQYAAPLIREIASIANIDFTVYYCSRQGVEETLDKQFGTIFKWDIPLLGGYNYTFLPNFGDTKRDGVFFRLINPAIVRELYNKRYDFLIVHGYEHFTKWIAFATAVLCGTKIILRGESNSLNKRTLLVRVVKRIILRLLFYFIHAAIYIGHANRTYYLEYGLPEKKLFFAPYIVDNTFFQNEHKKLSPRRRELRERVGVNDERPLILFAGKLLEKKQPIFLLKAYQKVREETNCALVFAGDGILREEILKIVSAEKIPDVTITGFLNQSQISEAYTLADIFVLPSYNEPWGVVVNEAMNFGLPVIVTENVGCAPDLVQEGQNGWVVGVGDLDTLSGKIKEMVIGESLRATFGQKSKEIIKSYSPKRCAIGILKAMGIDT